MTLHTRGTDTVSPTPTDTRVAQRSSKILAKLRPSAKTTVELRVKRGKIEETVTIPASAFVLLTRILSEMSQGKAITLIPNETELTTQQAAELLNVSRPYLVSELESGSLPFRKVGKHRRILFKDLLAYKLRVDRDRRRILKELTAQAQELRMGYDM